MLQVFDFPNKQINFIEFLFIELSLIKRIRKEEIVKQHFMQLDRRWTLDHEKNGYFPFHSFNGHRRNEEKGKKEKNKKRRKRSVTAISFVIISSVIDKEKDYSING